MKKGWIFKLFQGDIYQKFNEMRTYDKCIQFNGKPDKELIGNISDNPEWKEWLVYYVGIIEGEMVLQRKWLFFFDIEQVTFYSDSNGFIKEFIGI